MPEDGTSPRGAGWPPRSHLIVLLLCALGVVAHQWVRLDWFIDDAAIVYAYARNIAAGEGIVPWPGAERIEAYSDPLWVLLFVGFEHLGFNGFQVAKPLAMVLSVLCLPAAYALTREARPGCDRAPVIAPIFIALNAQIAIWSMSGLENSLFFLLVLLGARAVLVDARTGRFPRSAIWFLLLAFTRPDGIAYAAVAGFWYLGLLRRAGHGWRGVAWWLGAFWGPYLAHEAWRLWYFAWPLPNTYYAKLETRDTFPLIWGARGWSQLREWAARLWHGYYLPVYLAGLVGLRGRPARWAFGAAALLALSLLWPGTSALRELWWWPELPEPPSFVPTARVIGLYAAAALLPLATRGRPGGAALGLCWHLTAVALAFGIYANGDWMGGYRWMSLAMPTASVLFAVGVVEWADRLEGWLSTPSTEGVARWLATALLVTGMLPPNFSQTRDHLLYNNNETPTMVKRRADYTKRIARRTFYDGTVVNLEMDQGAHLFWRPEYVEVDMAGLVDIPMARHRYAQTAFIQEYVFDEMQPTFAHVHGGWAKGTRLKEYDSWKEMFELPRYPDGRFGLHPGVWARRSLLLQHEWEGPEQRTADFGDGFELVGFEVPNREWGRGRYGYLEAAFHSRDREPGEHVQVVAFVGDGETLRTWDLAMGRGLIDIVDWRPDEIFVGRWPLWLPDDLPEGDYTLGFLVLDAHGRVRPPLEVGAEAVVADGDAVEPWLAAGEVRFRTGITVVPGERVEPLAAERRDEALALAGDGRCEAAEAMWIRARRQVPHLYGWHDTHLPAVSRALADCWARLAEGHEDAPALLARAHRWDHHSPALARVGSPVGDRLWSEGLAARERKDWETAYRTFTALLGFQPWRSWARRHAEHARDQRLGITGDEAPFPDKPPEAGAGGG